MKEEKHNATAIIYGTDHEEGIDRKQQVLDAAKADVEVRSRHFGVSLDSSWAQVHDTQIRALSMTIHRLSMSIPILDISWGTTDGCRPGVISWLIMRHENVRIRTDDDGRLRGCFVFIIEHGDVSLCDTDANDFLGRMVWTRVGGNEEVAIA